MVEESSLDIRQREIIVPPSKGTELCWVLPSLPSVQRKNRVFFSAEKRPNHKYDHSPPSTAKFNPYPTNVENRASS